MAKILGLIFALLLYPMAVIPLAEHMVERPVAIKLGYTPDARIVRLVAGDQKNLLAQTNILRVLFYFGTLVDQWRQNVLIQPEYYNMFKTLESAIQLDPYNMDAYYFAQAAFTWEVGRAADVNRLLDYGMRYRHWDWSLAFYAGFNAAYFLNDYPSAARYMEKAAELSGMSLLANLAARFHYEAGASGLGVAFLDTMIEQATEPRVRELYQVRKNALLASEEIETALALFRKRYGRTPETLNELVECQLLPVLPMEPYGGSFYLDEQGRVRSTSAFAPARDGRRAIE